MTTNKYVSPDRSLATHYLDEMVHSIKVFEKAEIKYDEILQSYINDPKYSSTRVAQVAANSDKGLESTGKRCQYFRDRATMYGTAYLALKQQINDAEKLINDVSGI